jgi:hypothetical protein
MAACIHSAYDLARSMTDSGGDDESQTDDAASQIDAYGSEHT